MESFTRIRATAAPMMRINIDTDQIIPTRFLLRTSEEGLNEGLFANWRSLADGTPNPEFILNRAPYNKAEIILADRNFGCGSSREAAPRALRQSGFRAVIAPSFGDIFFGNCFRNGVLPVILPIETVNGLAQQVASSHGTASIEVDLEHERVTAPDGLTFAFATPKKLRDMLLNGLDEIDLTMQLNDSIARFRATDREKRPWAYLERGSY